MSKLEAIRNLTVGESLDWHDAPLSSGMISDAIGGDFEVRWITTNWDASQGYHRITRHKPEAPKWVEVRRETAYGRTTELPFAIRVY